VALLSGHVIILAIVALVATRDPSFAVTPDYYEQAVAWDATQAAKRHSAQLGWKLQITPADEADALARRTVTFTLIDAVTTPVAKAKIDVICFHHSRANQAERFTLTTDDEGKASRAIPIRHAGFWDFQCKASAGEKTFTTTLTQFINPPARLAAAGRSSR
jgi:nitrogen fixation protein FixH